MNIPCLGVPILNRHDLLDTLLASIDHPVERLFIVDNGDVVGLGTQLRHNSELHVCNPGCNLGVAESWNLIIRTNIHADFWVLTNADIVFAPGALADLSATMNDACEVDTPLVACLVGYGAHAVNAAAIETVGWYDPQFSPIYYEDSDWQRRALLLGVEHVFIHSETAHLSETTVTSSPDIAIRNHETRYRNREAYERKWGTTVVGEESHLLPYNGSILTPRDVTLPSLSWLREQSWDRPLPAEL